jgi:hypothetical protein
MNRRDFTKHLGVAVIAIPAAKLLAACTGSSSATVVVLDLATGTAPGPTIDASTPQVSADLATNGVAEDLSATPPPDLAVPVTSITYTSSNVLAHTHQVTISTSNYTSPPADGLTQDTTIAQGHNHTVTLTQAQLATIGGGGTVTVDTSFVGNHLHTFTFTNAG